MTFQLSLIEMHLYAFIAILVPKLVAMVMPFVPCARECHWWIPNVTNPISKPNSAWICCTQLKLWSFFVTFWPILATVWLPWQSPLDPCNQKCLFWIGRPQKTVVIRNRILVISHTNALICIYGNLVPKLVAMVTPLCPLCRGVSRMNSPTA